MTRSESESESSSESFSESFSESESEVEVPVFVPIPVRELTTETEWSREEKVSRIAQTLKYQQQRHCFIKLDNEATQPLKVPFVRDYAIPEKPLQDYQRRLYFKQGALTAIEADRLIAESERAFLMNLAEAPPEGLTLLLPSPSPGANDDGLFE